MSFPVMFTFVRSREHSRALIDLARLGTAVSGFLCRCKKRNVMPVENLLAVLLKGRRHGLVELFGGGRDVILLHLLDQPGFGRLPIRHL